MLHLVMAEDRKLIKIYALKGQLLIFNRLHPDETSYILLHFDHIYSEKNFIMLNSLGT